MANTRRRLTGRVISNKMDKTVTVQVKRTYRHPLYGKVVRKFKRYMAHDEGNECHIGDTVLIVESRPLSRYKRWAVQEIIRSDVSARTAEVESVASVDVMGEEETDETQTSTPTEMLDSVDATVDDGEA